MGDHSAGQDATPEVLANQISVALAGSAIEQLWHYNSDMRNYIINTAWKYFNRRMGQINQFENNNIGPTNNDRLPYLKRDFTGVNLAAVPPDSAEY